MNLLREEYCKEINIPMGLEDVYGYVKWLEDKIKKEQNMKTKIILAYDEPQSELKKGMKGYVDGYVNIGASGRPYAVVVCEGIIDTVPINYLIVDK